MSGPHNAADSTFDLRRIAKRIGLFVVVGLVGVLLLATLPGIGEVRERVGDANPWWLLVAALARVASCMGFVLCLWGAFDRFMPFRAATDLGMAEQGANVLLPAGGTGGPAFGVLLMRQRGVPTAMAAERHAALFLGTSGVSLAGLLIFGILGLALGHPSVTLCLIPIAIGGGGILLSIAFASTRVPVEPSTDKKFWHGIWRLRTFLHSGVRTTFRLAVRGDWTFAAGAIAYYALDIASLGATFQALGTDAPVVETFVLAYTIGHAGAFIPTPGGVGGTDGGLIGSFALYGAELSTATAAVLAYRVFQLGIPIVLGAIGMIRLRARLGSEEQRAAIEARFSPQTPP